MVYLTALWLPILVATILVFVVSSILHMVTPWHKNDFPRVPNEDRILDALRPLALPEGDYFMPRPATRADLNSPAFLEKVKRGPVVLITVMPTGMSMGRNLALWFTYCVVVSIFAAYITGRALPAGADYLRVFQFVGAVAFSGYSLALLQMSIWYRRAWSLTVKATIDGLIYASVTAGAFGWLWPHA